MTGMPTRPRLSVNVNKVATIRNARGGDEPSVLEAVEACIAAGAPGITVHPRADARHITAKDVRAISVALASRRGGLGIDEQAHAYTGLPESPDDRRQPISRRVRRPAGMAGNLARLHRHQRALIRLDLVHQREEIVARVPLDVELDGAAARWAAAMDADRVELYTEPFARAFATGRSAGEESFRKYTAVATLAHQLGLGVNAGHDLDLDNLVLFRTLPHLDEVSIGHALISHALFVGLDRSVREYLTVLGE